MRQVVGQASATHPESAPPLVVAVTGLDREQLEKAGAAFDRHLLKPAPVSDVVDILNDPQIVVAE